MEAPLKPTLPWKHGLIRWVEDCGCRPHYHVVQMDSVVCLGDAEGADSLARAARAAARESERTA